MERMTEIMDRLRAAPPEEIGGRKVLSRSDYLRSVRIFRGRRPGEIALPKSNVLTFQMEGPVSLSVPPAPSPKNQGLLLGQRERT